MKNKHKALVSCRKKAKQISSLEIVRKRHKFSRRYMRKIPQRVTTSGKKTPSHKKVTEYIYSCCIWRSLWTFSEEKKSDNLCNFFSINVLLQVPLQNEGQNGELVENDVKKFLKKFSQDKLNISPREPSESHASVDPSPWDPEHTPVSIDRHSRHDLTGSERFLPCQDCYIDLDLFL